jgi:hypothetical protein
MITADFAYKPAKSGYFYQSQLALELLLIRTIAALQAKPCHRQDRVLQTHQTQVQAQV